MDLDQWEKDGKNPENKPQKPKRARYLIEGTTTEALSEVLRNDEKAAFEAPSTKVLLRQDELSEFIANLDRYSGGRGGGDRGAYLRLFNGGSYAYDRVGRGSFLVPNWSANLLGGIQPEPIQRTAKEAVDDGLLQRIIFVVPEGQGTGEDRVSDRDAWKRYCGLFRALADMPAIDDGTGKCVVRLEPTAHAHRQALDAFISDLAAASDTSVRMASALGKWRGLFARLTLVFHLIKLADAKMCGLNDVTPNLVHAETASMVEKFMLDILLPHLRRADALMFETRQSEHVRWIAGWILAKGYNRVSVREVQRAYRALKAPEHRRDLDAVMEDLVAKGWLKALPGGTSTKSITNWEINPRVHETFAKAARAEAERRKSVRDHLAQKFQHTAA
jgi:hypothetical protein